MYCVLVCAQPVTTDEDVTDVIDALNAAIEVARWKLEFYGTYRYRAAWGTSRAEAIANVKKSMSVVRGIIARRGDLFRVSGRSDSGGNWPANFECIESPTVMLHWYLPSGVNYGLERQRATVMRSPRGAPDLSRLLYTCSTVHLDPFQYGGWLDGQVIQRYEPQEVAGKKVIERIERPDPTQLVYYSELYQGDQLQTRRRVTISTKYQPAVVIRRERISENRESGAQAVTEFLLEADEFVQVKGGWLPSRVTRVSGPYAVKDKAERQWMCDEWVSDDLGKRAPTAGDFVITIPEHVEVRGLKGEYSVGRVRRLDMNTVTLADLEAAQDRVDVDGRPATAKPAGWKAANLLWTILGVMALAAVGVAIWWAHARRRAA
jgi:hypothetical protein